ncbi:MAG: TetR family transcriptional regulator [Ahrensia sp.]
MARKAKHDDIKTIERAVALFWRQGYAATSLKDIETALDLGPGSIYARFGSKAGAYQAALINYAEARREDFHAHIDAAPRIIDGIAAHVRSLAGICNIDQPSAACMLMKSMTEFNGTEPGLFETAADLLAETEEMFAEALRAAQKFGEIDADADPAFIAANVQAQIMGIRAYAQKPNAEVTVARMVEGLAQKIEALADSA